MMHVDPSDVRATRNYAAAMVAPEHEPPHRRWYVLHRSRRVCAHVGARAYCNQRTDVLRIAACHLDHLGSYRRRLARAVLLAAPAVLANRQR
jgi:hypothetical protein